MSHMLIETIALVEGLFAVVAVMYVAFLVYYYPG